MLFRSGGTDGTTDGGTDGTTDGGTDGTTDGGTDGLGGGESVGLGGADQGPGLGQAAGPGGDARFSSNVDCPRHRITMPEMTPNLMDPNWEPALMNCGMKP